MLLKPTNCGLRSRHSFETNNLLSLSQPLLPNIMDGFLATAHVTLLKLKIASEKMPVFHFQPLFLLGWVYNLGFSPSETVANKCRFTGICELKYNDPGGEARW